MIVEKQVRRQVRANHRNVFCCRLFWKTSSMWLILIDNVKSISSIYPPSNYHSTWKFIVRRQLSFGDPNSFPQAIALDGKRERGRSWVLHQRPVVAGFQWTSSAIVGTHLRVLQVTGWLNGDDRNVKCFLFSRWFSSEIPSFRMILFVLKEKSDFDFKGYHKKRPWIPHNLRSRN